MLQVFLPRAGGRGRTGDIREATIVKYKECMTVIVEITKIVEETTSMIYKLLYYLIHSSSKLVVAAGLDVDDKK